MGVHLTPEGDPYPSFADMAEGLADDSRGVKPAVLVAAGVAGFVLMAVAIAATRRKAA